MDTSQVQEVKKEDETVAEVDTYEPATGNKPLVPGFRNKVTVLPLAALQKDIENLRQQVGGTIQQLQEVQQQQLQHLYKVIGEIAQNQRTLSLTVEAMARLSNTSVADLDRVIAEVEAEKEAELEAQRDEKAGLKKVDRAAQENDVIKINFVGKLDGVPFAGGSQRGANLNLGSKQFIPGFEDQCIGAKAGDKLTVKVTPLS